MRAMREKSLPAALQAEGTSPVVRLWLLRMLVPLDGLREFITRDGVQNFSLARTLGLEKWNDPTDADFDWTAARRELRQLYQHAGDALGSATAPQILRSNIARLSKIIGLSPTDCRLLEFASLLRTEQSLQDATSFLGPLSTMRTITFLSAILDQPREAIKEALSRDGLLERSGLLKVEREGACLLDSKITILSDDFAGRIVCDEADPADLIRETVTRSPKAELTLNDYEHIKTALAIAVPYLTYSFRMHRKGVNMLLYGRPGTGKTQLVRVLADSLGCPLYEIACDDSDGRSIDGDDRLRAFSAAQCFFGNRRTLLLFDEIEDIFQNEGPVGYRSPAQLRKAWMNRTLEESAVPAIWVSNSPDLDPAFIRRFDMVVELPVPPRHQREQIVRTACPGLLDKAVTSRLAESEMLAPALVTRAAAVVGSIAEEFDGAGAAEALEFLVSSTLRAQGHPAIRSRPQGFPSGYDPDFIHADTDLSELTASLQMNRSGLLCFHGPPGTGKTAFAHWLADALGMPLITRRGSDLLSPFVGLSEKNIDRAFRDAERAHAVLLFDEVESFLQQRRGSMNSWEVTIVNEMLVQLEAFSGIFIASTNLVDQIDEAALRRFDFRIKFGFLRPAQTLKLLATTCQRLGIPMPSTQTRAMLTALDNLTLGDFALVQRQSSLRPVRSADAILAALQTEATFRRRQFRIGFV